MLKQTCQSTIFGSLLPAGSGPWFRKGLEGWNEVVSFFPASGFLAPWTFAKPANLISLPCGRILQAVIAPGTTYAFGEETSYQDVFAYLSAPGLTSFVPEGDGEVVGMFKLVANQGGLGAHVANASFMVSPRYSGKGLGREMGPHCLKEVKKAGYLTLQFNFPSASMRLVSHCRKSPDFLLLERCLRRSSMNSWDMLTPMSCIVLGRHIC